MARDPGGVTMAVSDIRLKVGLLNHRKYRRLRRLLGPGALEYLVSLWTEVALQAPDGNLEDWPTTDIEHAVRWDGPAGALVDAFVSCGFLERTAKGGLKVHDWDEHQSWIIGAPKRTAAALKANRERWKNSGHRPPQRHDVSEPDSESDPERIGSGLRIGLRNASDSGEGRGGTGKAFHRGGDSVTNGEDLPGEEGLS
jgi:hypothetical protein